MQLRTSLFIIDLSAETPKREIKLSHGFFISFVPVYFIQKRLARYIIRNLLHFPKTEEFVHKTNQDREPFLIWTYISADRITQNNLAPNQW
jgi:hypothetical protein